MRHVHKDCIICCTKWNVTTGMKLHGHVKFDIQQTVKLTFFSVKYRGLLFTFSAKLVMMMIAFITFKSSLVPLFEGL